MKYPAYPRYRASGLTWLPRIPSEWKVHRLKWSVTGCDNGVWGDEPEGGVDDVVGLRVADFARTTFRIATDRLTVRSVEEPQRRSRQVKKGDLLIEKSGGGEKQLVGCVVLYEHDFDAVCSNFVARMPVAEEQCSRYWAYVHAALYAAKLNYPAIKQTTGIQNLDASEYLATRVAYPALDEQERIADFLDWKTGQIDTLIAKKQALIAFLDEKRLCTITKCVAGGGRWPSRRIRTLIEFLTSGSRGWADFFADTGPLFIRITNLQRDEVSLLLDDLQRVNPPDSAEGLRTKTRAGDLLISITADLGSVAVIPADLEPAFVSQHLALVRVDTAQVSPHWVAYTLLSSFGRYQLQASGYGGTKVQLGLDDIRNFEVFLPPGRIEQDALIDELEKKLNRIDALCRKVNTAIIQLTEYRSALITAATTGQIDVRGVAIPRAA